MTRDLAIRYRLNRFSIASLLLILTLPLCAVAQVTNLRLENISVEEGWHKLQSIMFIKTVKDSCGYPPMRVFKHMMVMTLLLLQ